MLWRIAVCLEWESGVVLWRMEAVEWSRVVQLCYRAVLMYDSALAKPTVNPGAAWLL